MFKQGVNTLITLSSRIGRTCTIQAEQKSLLNSLNRSNKYNTSSRLLVVETTKEPQNIDTGSDNEKSTQPKQHKKKQRSLVSKKEVIRGENLLISKTINRSAIREDRGERQSKTGTLAAMGKQYRQAKKFIPMENIEGLNKHLVTAELQKNICVTANVAVPKAEQLMARAKHIAEQLGLEVMPNLKEAGAKYPFTLLIDSDDRIKLQQLNSSDDRNLPGPIYSAFPSADLGIKAKFQYNLRSPLVRSLGKAVPLTDMRVVDATGGLGIDAFVLTYFGVHMTIIERNPIVYTLLREGYEVAKQNELLKDMMARITIIHGDSNDVLPKLAAELKPHVIYLDPMYPLRVKTNAPMSKKEMVIARKLLGPDPNAEDMVAMALQYASSHVVLKRPYYVEPSPNAVTAYKARSTRFEIFSKHKTNSFEKDDGDSKQV